MSAGNVLGRELIEQCYRQAKADRWELSHDSFAAALTASAAHAFADRAPSRRELEGFVKALHLEDLALACACAEGTERAWDHFIVEYRPILYRAADVTGQSMRGREVADSLYGELFGLRLREGERRSPFRYYHGRSSLATWLRAVFSQRFVDTLRASARLDPLPDDESHHVPVSPAGPSTSTLRALRLLEQVIAAVVATLSVRDRFRLRYYYAQDLTLAQIGRLLGEHEATVSRGLARTRKLIRKEVEHRLRHEHHFMDAEVHDCFAAAAEDAGPMELSKLLGAPAEPAEVRKEAVTDRST